MGLSKRTSIQILGAFFCVWVLILSTGITAQSLEKVQFQHAWIWQPNISPYWAAIKNGYFKEEGLEVNFVEGKGSAYAIQRVAAEKADVGVSDLGAAAFAISRGIPVKAILCELQTGPQGIVSHKDTGIKTPKDLEGKKLGFSPGDSAWILFPAFTSANGVNASRVISVSAEPASLPKALLARNMDAILTYFTSVPEFSDRGGGTPLTYLRYADHNVNLLGLGLVAHTKTISERPKMLRGFVRASQRGFAWALKNPGKTIDILMNVAPLTVTKKKIAMQNLNLSLGLLHTERSKGKPIGWMAKGDWEQTVGLLAKYRKMKALPVDRYYTNEFIAKDY